MSRPAARHQRKQRQQHQPSAGPDAPDRKSKRRPVKADAAPSDRHQPSRSEPHRRAAQLPAQPCTPARTTASPGTNRRRRGAGANPSGTIEGRRWPSFRATHCPSAGNTAHPKTPGAAEVLLESAAPGEHPDTPPKKADNDEERPLFKTVPCLRRAGSGTGKPPAPPLDPANARRLIRSQGAQAHETPAGPRRQRPQIPTQSRSEPRTDQIRH